MSRVLSTNTAPTCHSRVGVRLHDLGDATLFERIALAGKLGFGTVHLASKDLFAATGATWDTLTPELAHQVSAACAAAGVVPVVFGCYQNIATPDEATFAHIVGRFAAAARFATALSPACVVGTETGRPNSENTIGSDRATSEALNLVAARIAQLAQVCATHGAALAIEPGYNEVLCTPERLFQALTLAKKSLEAAGSNACVKVIFDPVSLLHAQVVPHAQDIVQQVLDLAGDDICVVHAKDYELVPADGTPTWDDGSGKRLVCYGAGQTHNFDFAPLATWIAAHPQVTGCVVENATLSSAPASLAYLVSLGFLLAVCL